MKAQRKMQEIQPKIEEIKQKYKGDQQKIAQETMLIWKTQKVNPLGSCLPLLLQPGLVLAQTPPLPPPAAIKIRK